MFKARHRKRNRFLLLIGLVGGGVGAAWLVQHDFQLPKRFAEVVPSRLYRCGDVSPEELAYVADKFQIKTVLSLLNPVVKESVAERQAAQRLGLRWVNIPLRGNGESSPEQRKRIKAVLFDDQAGPLLVHCAAGTNRTGLAIGMYRLRRQNWTLDRVFAEMRGFGFDQDSKHQNMIDALTAEAAER